MRYQIIRIKYSNNTFARTKRLNRFYKRFHGDDTFLLKRQINRRQWWYFLPRQEERSQNPKVIVDITIRYGNSGANRRKFKHL